VPDGCDASDIKDPQNMNNNNIVSYLETLVARFKKQMDDAMGRGERPDPRTKTMWMECTKRMMTLVNAI